jgi:hypothetical protein
LYVSSFLENINDAMLTFRFDTIYSVFEKFNLVNNSPDFGEFEETLRKYTIKSQDKLIYNKEVFPYASKCKGCEFGCNINAYKVYSYFCDLRLEGNYAIKYDIENQCLVDFTWCAAFSKKEEIENGYITINKNF